MAEIVGIDIGNGYTKTVHSCFVSAVKNYGETKPAIMEKTVMYAGKYYTVGGKRTKTKTDQKKDETALILALAALGEEFKARNISPEEIIISEGLPLERCIEDNRIFDRMYYKEGEFIAFEYEDVPYRVHVNKVFVNPQGVSGAYDLITSGNLPPVSLLIDVGSWTVDVLPLIEGKPTGGEGRSLINGVINCMLSCNEEIRRRTGREVMESQIQQIMRGRTGILPPNYEKTITAAIKAYVEDFADTLIENGYNYDTVTCLFMGGGATVIKCYGAEIFPMSQYILDLKANAKGYEQIAQERVDRGEI